MRIDLASSWAIFSGFQHQIPLGLTPNRFVSVLPLADPARVGGGASSRASLQSRLSWSTRSWNGAGFELNDVSALLCLCFDLKPDLGPVVGWDRVGADEMPRTVCPGRGERTDNGWGVAQPLDPEDEVVLEFPWVRERSLSDGLGDRGSLGVESRGVIRGGRIGPPDWCDVPWGLIRDKKVSTFGARIGRVMGQHICHHFSCGALDPCLALCGDEVGGWGPYRESDDGKWEGKS